MNAGVLVPLIVFAFVAWAVYQAHSTRREQLRIQAETQRHMLERLGSTQELSAFLATPEGKEFFKAFERAGSQAHRGGAARHGQVGVILLALAAGMLAVEFLSSQADGIGIGGAIVGGLGVGFLLAAMVAWKWGGDRDTERTTDGGVP